MSSSSPAFEDKVLSLLGNLMGRQADLLARVNACERDLAELTHDLEEYRDKRDNLERLRA